MQACGIVAEFDPFHSGHAHLISEARRLSGCGYVVCVLSTAFLQRGAPGMFSTRDRTRMALAAGADAVFALPARFSCAPADRFALGAVDILHALKVVGVQAFGCEDADRLPALVRAAECLNAEPSLFRETLRRRLDEGLAYPAAQAEAVEACTEVPRQWLTRPNNILAVAYLRRLDGTGIRPLPIQRVGARDGDGRDGYPPSSALRRQMLAGEADAALAALPPAAADIARECLADRRVCAPDALSQALLYRLHTSAPEDWAAYFPAGEGLERRLSKALAARPDSLDALLGRLKTRRYTHASLRRALSRLLLGMPYSRDPAAPEYIRLLGFRASARPLLRRIRDSASLPVITRPANEKTLLADDALAETLWGLGAGRPQCLYTQSPVAVPASITDAQGETA